MSAINLENLHVRGRRIIVSDVPKSEMEFMYKGLIHLPEAQAEERQRNQAFIVQRVGEGCYEALLPGDRVLARPFKAHTIGKDEEGTVLYVIMEYDIQARVNT